MIEKFPCVILGKMLLKQNVFMKLYCDTKLSQLISSELVDELKEIHKLDNHELHEINEHTREKLKKYQRTRSLILWHDGSPLSSQSHILIMVAFLYDIAAFYTVMNTKKWVEKVQCPGVCWKTIFTYFGTFTI